MHESKQEQGFVRGALEALRARSLSFVQATLWREVEHPPSGVPEPRELEEKGLWPGMKHEQLANLHEALTQIRETVSGHRRALLAEGFCEEAVDEMAADLHRVLISSYWPS